MKYLNKLAALAVLLGSTSAFAAVTQNAPVFPQTPNNGHLQFTSSSSAGTYATLYTAGSNGSVCFGMVETNNDATVTAGHLITIQIVNGGTKYGGTAFQSTPSAGFASGGAVGTNIPPDTITGSSYVPGFWRGLEVDGLGNFYKQLVSGDTIQVTFATAITSSDFINLQVDCNDF